MNTTYRFHPGEYELGENEKFYGDMEARGWRLVTRGRRLSRFERTEPSGARYRIEVCCGGFLEEPGLTEGQLAVFEDCGWEHICSRSFLHIFRAPAGSGAPEFYTDPRQQAVTLKKVRRDIWWSTALIFLALAGAAAFTLLTPSSGRRLGKAFQRALQAPTVYAFYAAWLLWSLCQAVWGTWKISRTYRRLKKGQPLDHAPKGKRVLQKIMNRGLLCLALLSALLTAAQLFAVRSQDLPQSPDGPYIMLGDLGWEGERGTIYGRESGVTYTRSFLTDYWETLEVLERPGEGTQAWMYQYIYRLRLPGLADRLARALMEAPVLARGPESFAPVDVPGLDAAWITGGMEAVAVRGNLVAYVEILSTDRLASELEDVLAALAERWAETADATDL